MTPAEMSEAVAAHFSNSRVLLIEEMGHVPEAISNIECRDRIMLDFYTNSLSTLDTACVENMRAPAFEIVAGRD